MQQISKIIPIVIVLVIFCAQIQQVQAESIITTVGQGYDAGKEQGKKDFREGNGHNDNCPSNVGIQYCTGYVIGYNIGYGASKISGD